MAWLANIVYTLAALVYLPVLAYQMAVQGKNRRGWPEKLLGPRRIAPPPDTSAKRIWVHAVSLGEINAARCLVQGLEERCPDHEVLVSTTTDTGYARACQLYGPDRVFRYPLDFSWAVRAALRRIQPAMIVLVELEVWFNLVTTASRTGIPVCVVNGRLTERSRRRFALLGPLGRRMFRSLRWVGAQDERIAARFASLGVPADRLTVTGSVKWDTAQVVDRIDGQDELAAAMGIDRPKPLWVCGSTGPGEEEMLLGAFERLRRDHRDLQLAIVPRKPERFDEVAELIRRRGFDGVRRSRSKGDSGKSWTSSARDESEAAGAPPFQGWGTDAEGTRERTPEDVTEGGPTVFLGDTMGELRKFYALADVVFVGRSLVPMGGSDPMEVAALAKAVIVGPHMDNFLEPARALEAGGGLRQVSGADGLRDAVAELLRDPSRARAIGDAGRKVVIENQGATRRTINALVELHKRAGHDPSRGIHSPDQNPD